MGTPIREHIAELLLTNKRHARYAAVLACLALVVAVGVAGVLRRQGNAMTHEETVLDCQYSGTGAHTHAAECHDADGNLVCPLEERELHTHDDSCYEETRVLVCGLEESEDHAHDDSCYETERELVCGKDEVTEEHVHGPGCFKTIETDDSESETPYPAQELEETLTRTDENGDEYVASTVAVKAPEGALPEGTTLEFKDIAESDEGIESKAAAAIEQDKGDDATLAQWEAVNFAFYDQDGNEVIPKKKVEVKLSTLWPARSSSPFWCR